jgi:hypothetical protein
MSQSRTVTTAAELQDAVQAGVQSIEVKGIVSGMPMITLGPGVRLHGGTLEFKAKGLRLTRDNELEGVTVRTSEHELAILNDTSAEGLGNISLSNVRTVGQVLLLAEDAVRSGHVLVRGLHVARADVRGRMRRPHGFGVDALQGAFTLWNRQADPAVVITAELLDISAGSAEAPVRGSGVFVGGHGDWNGKGDGGTLRVSALSTGDITSDGGIASGTPDLISGGVFVISGAVVDEVINNGPVTTHGQNDMVLDNWGHVKTWTARNAVTSRGPSGIGFVNFGELDRLDVQGPVRTFGAGARGFNAYDGSLRHASFASIATQGDGSVGVQVSRSLPILEIAGDLSTQGGEGESLVKGVQMSLMATALSVKPGGEIGVIRIGGQVRTASAHVVTIEIEGQVGEMAVTGGVFAEGKSADAIHLNGVDLDTRNLKVSAADGEAIVRSK